MVFKTKHFVIPAEQVMKDSKVIKGQMQVFAKTLQAIPSDHAPFLTEKERIGINTGLSGRQLFGICTLGLAIGYGIKKISKQLK